MGQVPQANAGPAEELPWGPERLKHPGHWTDLSVLISLPGRHGVRGKLTQNPSVFTLHNWRHRGQGL